MLMLRGELQNLLCAYKYTHFCQAENHPGTNMVMQSVTKSYVVFGEADPVLEKRGRATQGKKRGHTKNV